MPDLKCNQTANGWNQCSNGSNASVAAKLATRTLSNTIITPLSPARPVGLPGKSSRQRSGGARTSDPIMPVESTISSPIARTISFQIEQTISSPIIRTNSFPVLQLLLAFSLVRSPDPGADLGYGIDDHQGGAGTLPDQG
jgi:hypothetical protein